MLTHLLGQSMDDIAARIPEYHAALREAGHDPADFTVTLMLHSYLADTREAAMETAREPMKEYLRAAAALVKQYAWAFPAFKKPAGVTDAMSLDLSNLDPDEMEASSISPSCAISMTAACSGPWTMPRRGSRRCARSA
ncbi:LLM class flavin-dependent oxidoreductase (plasmid) [Paracoccus marcusii]|uniref:LLM class flavin-dependent oxidoreductase n=1 Tax=Paracoccus marcusii TaxID=59779 RepID=UPI002ED31C21|nr:LLM class flavin-dependent oxidoreductase [Paracoccus marcusii]